MERKPGYSVSGGTALKHRIICPILAFFMVLSLLLLLFPSGDALAEETISLSPLSGTVGSTLSVGGTGFTANTTGTVTFGYGSLFPTTYSVTSNSAGSFFVSISVPAVPGGTYNILGTVGTSASASFTVVPELIMNTTSAYVGSSISLLGNGFSANLTASITYDGTSVTNASINATGSFNGTFTVPRSVYGTHTVTAKDSILSTSKTLWVTPTIALSPPSGQAGSSLRVTGNGFSSLASITVNFDGSQVTSATSDEYGDFIASFAVPSSTGGGHTIIASDSVASSSTEFTLQAGIGLGASSGSIGSQVTVTGTGFGSGTTVSLSFDAKQVADASTDARGSFNVSFTVPVSLGGAHTLTANDGTFSSSAVFTVLSSIKLNPTLGKVGSQIEVSGTGFSFGASVGISFENTLLATVSTNDKGSFSAFIKVPSSSAGNHAVSAADGTFTANGVFTTMASILVSPLRGPMGAQVTVSGTGFAANGTITIQVGNIPVKILTADAKGSFSEKFLVPQLDADNYPISATDGTHSDSSFFTITASFRISPTTGDISSNVTVSGTGLSGAVSVRYDDSDVATTTASANGAFSATFAVPKSVHGPHTISVNDATTKLQQSFVVESTPPPAPTLSQPKAGMRQSARPTLTWTPVTDPSSVTYTVQIATDTSFTKLVLERDSVTATQYELTSTEKLRRVSKNTPYYWRVKAVDLAQNEGDWSAPSSFYVTLLPPWLMWTLIGVGVLAILLLVWLWTRRKPEWLRQAQ